MAKATQKKDSTVGQRLREIREGLELSQKEFAKRLGLINESAISIYESGACLPQAETLIKIAEAFSVDIHELLTGQASPTIAIEIETLRQIKHQYRELLNRIRAAIKALRVVDGDISVAIEPLDNVLKQHSSQKG